MRPEALNFIVCPNCAGELSLSSDAARAPEDGHIMTGGLACRGCASQFAIRNGVPILFPANLATVKLETASRFAEEWTRWSDLRDYYEQVPRQPHLPRRMRFLPVARHRDEVKRNFPRNISC